MANIWCFIYSFSESDPYFDAACYFWCTEKGHLPTPTDNNIQLASANITAAAVSFNGSFLLLDTRNILVSCQKFYNALMNRECQKTPINLNGLFDITSLIVLQENGLLKKYRQEFLPKIDFVRISPVVLYSVETPTEPSEYREYTIENKS